MVITTDGSMVAKNQNFSHYVNDNKEVKSLVK